MMILLNKVSSPVVVYFLAILVAVLSHTENVSNSTFFHDDDDGRLLVMDNFTVEKRKIHPVTATVNKMLEDYDKRIRPDFYGPPVIIGISMWVKTLAAVSEVDMEFQVDFYLRQHWRDERLQFNLPPPNPQLNGSQGPLQAINLGQEFSQKIWYPDTFFPNEKNSYIHSATVTNEFIRLKCNGEILKSTRLTLTASCPMDLSNFPLDQQICVVEISSYGYSESDILYTWMDGNDSIKFGGSNALILPHFRVHGHRQRVTVEETSTGRYPVLYCEFLFVRSLTYYLIQVYIPAALIVIISWFALWMDRGSTSERVALGVTSVLTITTLLLSTNTNSPKISYIKSLDIYLAICFGLVFASLLQSTAVGYFLRKIQSLEQTAKSKMNGDGQRHADLEKVSVDNNGAIQRWRSDAVFPQNLNHEVTELGDNRRSDQAHQGVEEEGPDSSSPLQESCSKNTKNFLNGPEDEVKIAKIDIFARFLFPAIFSVFNIIYWAFYLRVQRFDRDESWILNS